MITAPTPLVISVVNSCVFVPSLCRRAGRGTEGEEPRRWMEDERIDRSQGSSMTTVYISRGNRCCSRCSSLGHVIDCFLY